MTEIKDIFTVIGALLGTIAFFMNFIKPILAYNKTKWNNLKKEIDDKDFDNIAYGLWYSRRIDSKSMERLERLIANIERDAEELRFKTIFKDKFREHFANIRKLFIKWIKFIQVPYWEPHKIPSGDYEWRLNKETFYKDDDLGKEDFKADKRYTEHLENAHDLIVEMRKEFKQISILANREAYEFLLPWKLVHKKK